MVEQYKTVYEGGYRRDRGEKIPLYCQCASGGNRGRSACFYRRNEEKILGCPPQLFRLYPCENAQEQMRCSDDGEPSQTAGKPMMDVLDGAGLTNTAVVVTRYFGGTLLGTGGLVRAYSAAVQEG